MGTANWLLFHPSFFRLCRSHIHTVLGKQSQGYGELLEADVNHPLAHTALHHPVLLALRNGFEYCRGDGFGDEECK